MRQTGAAVLRAGPRTVGGKDPSWQPARTFSTTSSGAASSRTRPTSTRCAPRSATGSVRFYVGFDPTAPSLHMGNLRPAAHRATAAGRRAHAVRPGRRRDRDDRRPAGLRRAHPQLRSRPSADWTERVRRQVSALRLLRGRQRRDRGQQPRLDRVAVGHRLPARHRQALPGEPDARPRHGAAPARVGDQLHRVLLRAAAVDGLPQPATATTASRCSSAAPTSGATSPAASS